MNLQIILELLGRRIEVNEGASLLEAAQKAAAGLLASCGGAGLCGDCRVRLVSGDFSKPSLIEETVLPAAELAQGWRLACQTIPLTNGCVEIPPESLLAGQKMQVDGQETHFQLEPAVRVTDVTLAAPTLADLRSDLTRVRAALDEEGDQPLKVDLSLLNGLPDQLRAQDWQARLVSAERSAEKWLVAVLPQAAPMLGLAVDMGSTKLACYLLNLENGATLAQTGVMNPQIAFGEDVVSRIAFANRSPENRRLLQTRLIETFNQTAGELCYQVGYEVSQIVDSVWVGNTAMQHFFLGLPVQQLGAAPYVAAVSDPLDLRTSEVGLNFAPGAWMHLPANIAGYVGGDHVAALLASRVVAEQAAVLVDIGTNTEISLALGGRLFSCSTASGPAFEGAHIHDGMRAAPGAIDWVRFDGEDLAVSTINNSPAVGICGTGILNLVSEMRRRQVIDGRGALNRQHLHVRRGSAGFEFLVLPAEKSGHGRDIVVTRRDVNEIQLAKGAIRAGIEVLLAKAQVSAQAVRRWVVAGAFGTYLDLSSALAIGMFPAAPLERFQQVGNAAGMGAKQMLLARSKRHEAAQLARTTQYVELTALRDFQDRFVEAMALTDIID